MRNFDKKYLRRSTILTNEHIWEVYDEILLKLGEYKNLVPKSYIYQAISDRTGYCVKKIADTINHYRRQ